MQLTMPSEPARAVSTAINTLSTVLQLICFIGCRVKGYRLWVGCRGRPMFLPCWLPRGVLFRPRISRFSLIFHYQQITRDDTVFSRRAFFYLTQIHREHRGLHRFARKLYRARISSGWHTQAIARVLLCNPCNLCEPKIIESDIIRINPWEKIIRESLFREARAPSLTGRDGVGLLTPSRRSTNASAGSLLRAPF